MSDTYDLIMAAYRGTEAAGRDFDALAVLVRDRQIASEGLILVEKDVEGRVTVRQTGDHLGRAGLGWGGGVGLLVGLSSGDGTAANARCVAKGSPGIRAWNRAHGGPGVSPGVSPRSCRAGTPGGPVMTRR